jgi:hypothetical protein
MSKNDNIIFFGFIALGIIMSPNVIQLIINYSVLIICISIIYNAFLLMPVSYIYIKERSAWSQFWTGKGPFKIKATYLKPKSYGVKWKTTTLW